MRAFKIVVVAAWTAIGIPAALAANPNEQACVLKAADTLPKIAGMKIGKSKATPMPAPAGWPGAGPPLRVEI